MAQNGQKQRNEWKSSREAAEYLGISEGTLYRLVDEGLLPAYRPGRSLRLRTPDLDNYLESVRVRPGDLAHLRSDATGRAAKAARNSGRGSDST
jgi:excisionase family DNA binding protein